MVLKNGVFDILILEYNHNFSSPRFNFFFRSSFYSALNRLIGRVLQAHRHNFENQLIYSEYSMCHGRFVFSNSYNFDIKS